MIGIIYPSNEISSYTLFSLTILTVALISDLHANQEFVKKLTKKFFIGLPILFNMNNTFNKSMQGFVEDYARETKDIIFFNIVNENNLILLVRYI